MYIGPFLYGKVEVKITFPNPFTIYHSKDFHCSDRSPFSHCSLSSLQQPLSVVLYLCLRCYVGSCVRIL